MSTRVFVCYSFSYKHIMEAMKGLLRALDFENVVVFDGPDDSRPPLEVVKKSIQEADCVLVLYGPQNAPVEGQPLIPAAWPVEEALYTHGLGKPLSLICHAGTPIPELLKDYQSPARFHFWDGMSFLQNVHHVVKHLLDFRRRLDFAGYVNTPYKYSRVELRIRIQRSGKTLYEDWYHEAIVAQQRNEFHHALSLGTTENAAAIKRCFDEESYLCEARTGGDWHRISLKPKGPVGSDFSYVVVVDPPLRPGEKIGYWRSFELPNRFPVKRDALVAHVREIRDDPAFPESIHKNNWFGEYIDIVYDVEKITVAIHFPRSVNVIKKCLVVESNHRSVVNKAETERCNHDECFRFIEDIASPETIMEMTVVKPLFNHSYYILYSIPE